VEHSPEAPRNRALKRKGGVGFWGGGGGFGGGFFFLWVWGGGGGGWGGGGGGGGGGVFGGGGGGAFEFITAARQTSCRARHSRRSRENRLQERTPCAHAENHWRTGKLHRKVASLMGLHTKALWERTAMEIPARSHGLEALFLIVSAGSASMAPRMSGIERKRHILWRAQTGH